MNKELNDDLKRYKDERENLENKISEYIEDVCTYSKEDFKNELESIDSMLANYGEFINEKQIFTIVYSVFFNNSIDEVVNICSLYSSFRQHIKNYSDVYFNYLHIMTEYDIERIIHEQNKNLIYNKNLFKLLQEKITTMDLQEFVGLSKIIILKNDLIRHYFVEQKINYNLVNSLVIFNGNIGLKFTKIKSHDVLQEILFELYLNNVKEVMLEYNDVSRVRRMKKLSFDFENNVLKLKVHASNFSSNGHGIVYYDSVLNLDGIIENVVLCNEKVVNIEKQQCFEAIKDILHNPINTLQYFKEIEVCYSFDRVINKKLIKDKTDNEIVDENEKMLNIYGSYDILYTNISNFFYEFFEHFKILSRKDEKKADISISDFGKIVDEMDEV